MIFLESSQIKDNIVSKMIKDSVLYKKFKSIKLVESGKRKNSKGENLYFSRFLFRDKNVFAIEFLSKEKNYKNLHGIVLYKGVIPHNTLYPNQIVDTENFIKTELPEILNKSTLLKEEFLTFLLSIPAFIMSTLTLLFVGRWINILVTASRDQEYAETEAEIKLNEFLFKNQKENDSAFDFFKNTTLAIKNLIHGNGRGVILYGKAGTSKTYITRRTLHFSGLKPGQDYTIIKGSSANKKDNLKIIYSTLYQYKDKLVVFDDFDSALEDDNVVNLLKAATDSYPIRIVSLPDLPVFSTSDSPLPNKFHYSGRIILITNKDNIDLALSSRMQSIKVDFTDYEFVQNIKSLLRFINPNISLKIKEEVYAFLEELLIQYPTRLRIDFRKFSAMVDLRVAYPNEWKEISKSFVLDP